MPSQPLMKVCLFTLLAALAGFASDDAQLALERKAQSDFDRVLLAPAPAPGDATACVQSQAALLPVAAPEELPLVAYHKAWCTLAGAAITGDAAAYRQAAAGFENAIAAWPARLIPLAKKKLPPEPVPSGLRVLAQVAKLHADPDDAALRRSAAAELASAVQAGACPASVMSAGECASLLELGREWEGWLALGNGDLPAAARDFAASPGWLAWVLGQQAFAGRDYPSAAAEYRKTVADWEARQARRPQPLADRLAPGRPLPSAYTELGGAQLLAGDPAAAIASLNQAVKQAPASSRALFLRATAKEAAGQADAALADYSFASRTAFANAHDLASGEAHLYRGILLYRRKDYRHAEDEFSSALNFEIPAALRADAVAWRRLAAVSGGSCAAGPGYLEQALPAASPFFPAREARAAIAACHASARR